MQNGTLRTAATQPVLRTLGLRVGYQTDGEMIDVVRQVSLNLRAGETLGLVGESGSGKSATALAIAGLLPPNGRVLEGGVEMMGQDLTKLSDRELRPFRGGKIGIVFQESLAALNPLLTIERQITESIAVNLGVTGRAARDRALELLNEVGIPDPERRLKQYPHQLSGGLRQRVGMAIALAPDPDVLIADEPTTALDVTVQAQLLELLRREQRNRRMAVLLITHDLGVVASLADRLAIMYAGRIVEEGTTEELFHFPRHPYTAGLLRSVLRLDDDPDSELVAIPGHPPTFSDLPSGCPFRTRCPLTAARCAREEPGLAVVAGTEQRVACWEAR